MDKGAQKQPQLPLKTRISLFFLNAVTDASTCSNGTVNRRLFSMVESLSSLRVPASSKPRKSVITSDVTVDPSRDLWFRLFVPCDSDQQKLPVIVFFHGGGFVYLSPDMKAYDEVCRRFARTLPAVVVSVNYRLAPEHPYPAQYDDGYDVVKFLDEQRGILPEKADLSRCFLAGDSAGGNLAHHVTLRAAQSATAFARIKVLGVVAIQPFFGGEEASKSEMELQGIDVIVTNQRTQFMWKALMPQADRDHQVINVTGPNAVDISKIDFPATMVVVAGFDSLKDRQIRYYHWLRNSGKEAYLVNYPNMIHAFYIFPELSESALLISEIKNFINKHSSGSAATT
ncbi:probable carboxylesterase 18 [Salvia miltiorrhiza]|uniref:probable carboxylesterase 18 n=1 Tax=Salvia miltiorrhiza TaxID=226208 RepID=UPI0025AB68BA|nr:probable carboxylesterase 18 [Salvia miltiorrhiza]